jgi:Fe-S oxidoreductase
MALEDLLYDINSCGRCSDCKWIDYSYVIGKEFAKICPSSARYIFDAYSCQGRLDIGLGLIKGELGITPSLVDTVYKCQLCGGCDIRCKRSLQIEPLQVLESLRQKCVEHLGVPLPAHAQMRDNIGRCGNSLGVDGDKKLDWLPQKYLFPRANAKVILFLGCHAAVKDKKIAEETIKILEASGTEFAVMPEEQCCGKLLWETGQVTAFEKAVVHNLEAIRQTGADTIITSCAGCYKTLKVDYARMNKKSSSDLPYTVLHIAEYANQALKAGKLKFSKPVPLHVTYHDPCHLGRLSEPWIHWEGTRGKFGLLSPPKVFRRGSKGIYADPREIIQSVPQIRLTEMHRIRENAWCCGSGGGVAEAFPDFADRTAKERLREASETGAEAIITACVRCKSNFLGALGDTNLKVLDIVELISQAV